MLGASADPKPVGFILRYTASFILLIKAQFRRRNSACRRWRFTAPRTEAELTCDPSKKGFPALKSLAYPGDQGLGLRKKRSCQGTSFFGAQGVLALTPRKWWRAQYNCKALGSNLQKEEVLERGVCRGQGLALRKRRSCQGTSFLGA